MAIATAWRRLFTFGPLGLPLRSRPRLNSPMTSLTAAFLALFVLGFVAGIGVSFATERF
jgi:CBS-domain-containing membrane protein